MLGNCQCTYLRLVDIFHHRQEMLADSNPMVVANAVAALAEIQESSGGNVFQVTSASLFKLLAALNECTEWGQVFILDSLVNYTVCFCAWLLLYSVVWFTSDLTREITGSR